MTRKLRKKRMAPAKKTPSVTRKPAARILAPRQASMPARQKGAPDPEALRRAEKKFWTWFWIIKSVLILIIFVLLFLFVARFLRVFNGI